MRDIKFRAWSKLSKKMINQNSENMWFSPNVDTTNNKNQSVSLNVVLSDKSFIVMQYTGLKDKNGVEIYESDVIRWGDDVIEVVTYDNESACFHAESSMLDSCMEVIGNLHQNPELLK